MSRCPLFVLVTLGTSLPACSDPPASDVPPVPERIGGRRSCIYGGGAGADYISLDERQRHAVVRIDLSSNDEASSFGAVCSGTLVSARWVLTAGHCTPWPSRTVARVTFPALGPARDESGEVPCDTATELGVSSRRLVPHPELDVLLVELDRDPTELSVPVMPIPVGSGGTNDVGRLVQLAGAGRTETTLAGTLRFAVEPIVEVSEKWVVVEGNGRSGACASDSGGPLLAREKDGAVHVEGVLSAGSGDCVGRDEYVNSAAFVAWATAILPSEPVSLTCGSLGFTGRCFDGVAVWSDGDECRAEHCADASSCGWDIASAGYRCVLPSADPCSGVTDVGVCEPGGALRCQDGHLDIQSCDECVRSPGSGQVRCVQ